MILGMFHDAFRSVNNLGLHISFWCSCPFCRNNLGLNCSLRCLDLFGRWLRDLRLSGPPTTDRVGASGPVAWRRLILRPRCGSRPGSRFYPILTGLHSQWSSAVEMRFHAVDDFIVNLLVILDGLQGSILFATHLAPHRTRCSRPNPKLTAVHQWRLFGVSQGVTESTRGSRHCCPCRPPYGSGFRWYDFPASCGGRWRRYRYCYL